MSDTLARTVSKFERNMTTNDLTKHNEVQVGYAIDNLKYCEFSDRIYTAGMGSVYKHITTLNPPSKARGPNPGIFGVMQELGIPEYGMGIKRDLVITDKLNGMSNAVRIGNHLIGGSYIDDGILVCKIDDDTPAMIANSVDFEVHKHMEL